MPTFTEILRSGKDVEFVGAFSYRDPVTDTTGVVYVSFGSTVPQTESTDTPASKTFAARLNDPGTLSLQLSEDLIFSGIAQSQLGEVMLDNTPAGNDTAGPFDGWLSLTFAGRDYTLYGGEAGTAFSTFEVLRTEKISGEPRVSATEVRVSLLSPMERLNVPLIVDHYVGIPTCIEGLTTSFQVNVPHIADYDVTDFTIFFRFNLAGNPAANRNLILKETAFNNRNFLIQHRTDGGFDCYASIGGVSNLLLNTTADYADGNWHTLVWSLLDKTTTYLMLDGAVIDTETAALVAGSVNVQTAQISMALAYSGGKFCDARLYNAYLSPDEARSILNTRIDGDETGVVGSWAFEDGSGAVVTDNSPNANHGAIAGTIDVAWKWSPTDLGMRELAGQAMPIVHGMVMHAPADLIDDSEERYRIRDKVANTLAADPPVLYSKAVELELVTDYTDEGGGVYQTTSEVDEPVTFAYTIQSEDGSAYPDLIAEWIVKRGGFLSSAISTPALNELRFILPFQSGWFHSGQSAQLQTVIHDLLVGGGSHLRQDAAGLFVPGYLLPTVSPGPYSSEEAVIDFHGNGSVNFGSLGGQTGSHSRVFWIKNLTFGLSARVVDTPIARKSGQYSIILTTNGALRVEHDELSPSGIETAANILPIEAWWCAVVTYNVSTGVRNLYFGPAGGGAVARASDTTTGSIADPGGDLIVGNLAGSISHLIEYDKVLSGAEINAIMSTPPVAGASNLTFYSSMTDGKGSTVKEIVSGGVGTLTSACKWAPQVTFDMATAGATFTPRQLIPASKVVVGFKENFKPLTESEIADGVSRKDRVPFKRQRQSVPVENPDARTDYLDTRSEVLRSPFYLRSQAQALARNVLSRLGPNRSAGVLENGGRDAVSLDLTDEIRIVTYRYGLPLGDAYRVVRKNVRYAGLTADLELWR